MAITVIFISYDEAVTKWGFVLISGGTADQKNYTLNWQMGFCIFLYLSGTFFELFSKKLVFADYKMIFEMYVYH